MRRKRVTNLLLDLINTEILFLKLWNLKTLKCSVPWNTPSTMKETRLLWIRNQARTLKSSINQKHLIKKKLQDTRMICSAQTDSKKEARRATQLMILHTVYTPKHLECIMTTGERTWHLRWILKRTTLLSCSDSRRLGVSDGRDEDPKSQGLLSLFETRSTMRDHTGRS